MVVSGCKVPSSVANLVKDSRGTQGGPPLVMRLSFTRFATELGALQPLTTTYNLLTNIYIQPMEPVPFFVSTVFALCMKMYLFWLVVIKTCNFRAQLGPGTTFNQ